MGDIAYLIGYFLLMLVAIGVAIIVSGNKKSWGLFLIGALVQLLSLIGHQKSATANGTDITLYWVIYLVLLIVGAILVACRPSRDK